jgi:quercetin dioxygenase-like cupin family protein
MTMVACLCSPTTDRHRWSALRDLGHRAPDGAYCAAPAPIGAAEPDPTVGALTVPPPQNGTKIRINEFPPGVVSPVHRTQSVDYGIVLEGEVVLVLDADETTLRAGDVAVQRGTSHRWENRTDRSARMAFILIDGAFTADLLATLGDDVLGGLLHDPMHASGTSERTRSDG